MKQAIFIVFMFFTINLLSQSVEKGIYFGKENPFTLCFMTISDSAVEVEYFLEKGDGIFLHIPSKNLVIEKQSSVFKPIFRSMDDSIKVFERSNHYLIKRKGKVSHIGNGLKRVKVRKSNIPPSEILRLRNKHIQFMSGNGIRDSE